MPCSACKAAVASTSLRRVCSRAAARRSAWYFRGDIIELIVNKMKYSPLSSHLRRSRHREHDAEAGFAAHHAGIGLRRLLERKHLDHRMHAGQGAELQCVLRVDGG